MAGKGTSLKRHFCHDRHFARTEGSEVDRWILMISHKTCISTSKLIRESRHVNFLLVDMDSSKYEQFINFLVDPERWTGRKFHLTDESHSKELQQAAIQLGIEEDVLPFLT